MNDNYELKLEQFSGPIEKLLGLIEERKMEITDLNLAEVTADFLNYVNGLKNGGEEAKTIDSRILADFIVIASQLLLIKSKALLPNLELTGEEENEIKDLENRLQFYKQFKPAMGYLKKLWENGGVSVSRPLFSGLPAVFYPAKNIKIEELQKLIREIFESFQQLAEKSQTVKSSLITLEEKIEEIMKRLGPDLNFGELTREKPRAEIVVLFLALLHLLAKQLIKVEQKSKFSDIMIEKM
jgi:segregation and condensation protein A